MKSKALRFYAKKVVWGGEWSKNTVKGGHDVVVWKSIRKECFGSLS